MTGSALLVRWLGSAAPAADAPTAEVDGRLVEAAQRDANAFAALVERNQPRVYATALRLLGDPAEAEDVAQEAFLRAYRNLHRFEVGRPFAPWVCAIAANVARDRLRRPLRRLRELGLFGRAAHTPAEPLPDPVHVHDERDRVQAALQTLRPRIREAVVLRFVADLSVEEVADALGIGVSAAKMRLKRGTEQLRNALER